ncbi:hypothetical protein P170DRAFT_478585 [Aspergillus steynii IBT 23096]|uniref:Zn(2)-C6 fungal-type domain-containing protein n=1 Tax=Aspergillus steynii IBT 23096 TaxID=1392250 RepID=A0A2I2FYC6_9EURO|nr:uncharacterized protein P170DRAFT_478585 [Aspergillus steynii IBT 23096]PLB45632.1 hypothetical protein P170DRAFT_478585 [Aspergillus steynii IBT 23096]
MSSKRKADDANLDEDQPRRITRRNAGTANKTLPGQASAVVPEDDPVLILLNSAPVPEANAPVPQPITQVPQFSTQATQASAAVPQVSVSVPQTSAPARKTKAAEIEDGTVPDEEAARPTKRARGNGPPVPTKTTRGSTRVNPESQAKKNSEKFRSESPAAKTTQEAIPTAIPGSSADCPLELDDTDDGNQGANVNQEVGDPLFEEGDPLFGEDDQLFGEGEEQQGGGEEDTKREQDEQGELQGEEDRQDEPQGEGGEADEQQRLGDEVEEEEEEEEEERPKGKKKKAKTASQKAKKNPGHTRTRRRADQPEADHSAIIRKRWRDDSEKDARNLAEWEERCRQWREQGIDPDNDKEYKRLKPKMRTGQACDRCVNLRQPCSKDADSCRRCREKGFECFMTDKNTGVTNKRGAIREGREEIQQLRQQLAESEEEVRRRIAVINQQRALIQQYGVVSRISVPEMQARFMTRNPPVPYANYNGLNMPGSVPVFDQTMPGGLMMDPSTQYPMPMGPGPVRQGQVGNGGYMNPPANMTGPANRNRPPMGRLPQDMAMPGPYQMGPAPNMGPPQYNPHMLNPYGVAQYRQLNQQPGGLNMFQGDMTHLGYQVPQQAMPPRRNMQPQPTMQAPIPSEDRTGATAHGLSEGTGPSQFPPTNVGNNFELPPDDYSNAPGFEDNNPMEAADIRRDSAVSRNAFDEFLDETVYAQPDDAEPLAPAPQRPARSQRSSVGAIHPPSYNVDSTGAVYEEFPPAQPPLPSVPSTAYPNRLSVSGPVQPAGAAAANVEYSAQPMTASLQPPTNIAGVNDQSTLPPVESTQEAGGVQVNDLDIAREMAQLAAMRNQDTQAAQAAVQSAPPAPVQPRPETQSQTQTQDPPPPQNQNPSPPEDDGIIDLHPLREGEMEELWGLACVPDNLEDVFLGEPSYNDEAWREFIGLSNQANPNPTTAPGEPESNAASSGQESAEQPAEPTDGEIQRPPGVQQLIDLHDDFNTPLFPGVEVPPADENVGDDGLDDLFEE